MLTMVYTTPSYTVVYNLFFIVVCVSFCLPVGVCHVFDMSVSWMDMSCLWGSGVRSRLLPWGVFNLTKLNIKQNIFVSTKKGYKPQNTEVEQFRIYICAFDQSCKWFLMNGSYSSVPHLYADSYFRRCTGG